MRELDNQEIKRVLLDTLLHFHNFCEEHGLRYSLNSGTLLGAVRHKGFIPWDDDIDVVIPRDDYERLRKIYPALNKVPHYVMHDFADPKDPGTLSFIKVSDERTITKTPFKEDIQPMGLFVDIFPLDGMPGTENGTVRHMKRIHLLRKLAMLASLSPGVKERAAWKNIIVALWRSIPLLGKPRFWNKLVDKLAVKYPLAGSRYAGNAVAGDVYSQTVRAEVYERPALMDFEGYKLWGIKDYDHYLTVCYGDYMTPPPEDKRENGHVAKCYWKEH